MDEYMSEMKIPRSRIAVLIGEKGEIKKKIEKALKVKLSIDSKEGEIEIICKDSINLMTAEKIVKAIGRGFNPKYALSLLKENVSLEVIDMTEFAGKVPKKLARLRSRLIGTNGKARKTIESLTNTKIVILGKTISIIGDYVNVTVAMKGVELLLIGKTHSTAYRWLEQQKKALREKDF